MNGQVVAMNQKGRWESVPAVFAHLFDRYDGMQLDAASRPADLQMIDVKEPDTSDADSRSLPKRL